MILLYFLLCISLFLYEWNDLHKKNSKKMTYVKVFGLLTVTALYTGWVLFVDISFVPTPNQILNTLFQPVQQFLTLRW
ncbi:hypothetical protein SAMN05421736_101348 [Evansella caseinilytica]|uniref:Uncharacterized protein n=1 Tax=Evansella caseinilytica TaxID=1503961 RepID=A0A1H3H1B8_9BACI|nr:hypothetical protein SAMN05421736_101348 [Evansella caseinilytica]